MKNFPRKTTLPYGGGIGWGLISFTPSLDGEGWGGVKIKKG
jgi:hypothetical protein